MLPFVLREKNNRHKTTKINEKKKKKTSTLAQHHELRVNRFLTKDHLFDLFCSVQVRSSMSKKQMKNTKDKLNEERRMKRAVESEKRP